MSSRDVPEPWAKLLVDVGLVDPRNGAPSMSRLAEESGVHASTISAMMYGDRRTRPESVDKIAATIAGRATMVDSDEVRTVIRRWVGQALGQPGSFQPHPDADLLTPQERKAVNELIRLLAASKREGGEHGGDTAATSISTPDVTTTLEAVVPRAFLLWAVSVLEAAGRPIDPSIRILRNQIAHNQGDPHVSAKVLQRLERELRGLEDARRLQVVAAHDSGPGEARPGDPEVDEP